MNTQTPILIPPGKRHVAVVGAGISGLYAALELARDHRVTLIEAAPRLGGHARTVMAGKRGDQPVDTGFIVFNKVNYPRLTALFERLDVPIIESNMSFAASFDGGALEYSTRTVATMFAQARNLVRPSHLRMVRDIVRFNTHAAREAEKHGDLPLGDFLDEMGLGQTFRDRYLGPISGAIWSTPSTEVMAFPARAMLRFFANHHLLSNSGQHQWWTVKGGSVAYVERVTAELRRLGVEIRTGLPVTGIRNRVFRPELRMDGGDWETFDDIICAGHADETRALLGEGLGEIRDALTDVRFQKNRAVLHSDATAMPQRRRIWAAWNYVKPVDQPEDRLALTYWMNKLQQIPEDDPLFVTLNPVMPICDDSIFDTAEFMHPIYDLPMARAVERTRAINGTNGIWIAGAWMHNGFHEDGCASAEDVTRAMAARSGAAQIA